MIVLDLTLGKIEGDGIYMLGKPIKRFKVNEPNDGKVTITITTDNEKQYNRIYFYKTKEEIYDLIRQGKPINLRYTYVKDFNIYDLHSEKTPALYNFDAEYCFWDGFANFINARFADGDINFRNSIFKNGVSFNHASFGNGNFNFINTMVYNRYKIDHANFGNGKKQFNHSAFYDVDLLSFMGTTFGNGDISYNSVKFGAGEVSFAGTTFGDGNVSFNECDFGDGYFNVCFANFGNGNIGFEDAKFGEGTINFNRANLGKGNVLFSFVKFGNGDVHFADSQLQEGLMYFDRCTFGVGKLYFASAQLKGSTISFAHTQFNETEISFVNATVDSLHFYQNTFDSHIDLRLEHINTLLIQDCIIEKTLKLDGKTDYQALCLLDTVNLGNIYVDWQNNNVYESIMKGNTYEDLYITDKNTPDTLKQKTSQFRMLKENFHNIGQYDDEDAAYKAYMDCKTKTMPGFKKGFSSRKRSNLANGIWSFIREGVKKSFYRLIDKISGYGTQPVRLFWTCVGVIAICGIFFSPYMFDNYSIYSITYGLYHSAITFLTIGYNNITPLSEIPAILSAVEGFLGLFLMSFFTVAVARKLLR